MHSHHKIMAHIPSMCRFFYPYISVFGLAVFLLFSFTPSPAQTIFFDNYTSENGLDSKVYTVLQDKNHIIWLGTPGGLTHFDGNSFKAITTEDGLAEKGVRSIFEDTYGNIWFGHLDGGISRLKNRTFESLPENLIFKKDVVSFSEDNQGRLWITSFGSGAMLIQNPDAPLEDLKYEQYSGRRLSDLVYGVFRLHDQRTYFITDVGLKVYNEKENNFDNYLIPGLDHYFNIICVFEDRDQNIWIGTYHGGLYKYQRSDGKIKIYDVRDGLSSNWISCITQDHGGDIWVGTWGGGITRIHRDSLKIYNEKNGLPDANIHSITQDAEGNMLIGTATHGLCIFKGEAMITFNSNNIFPNNQIWSIANDHTGKIWFGTNEGISIYDPHAEPAARFTVFKGDDTKIPSQVRYICEDKNNNLWIGTNTLGVYQYHRESGKFESCLNINTYLPPKNWQVTAMAADHKGFLWIGSADGLFSYDPLTGKTEMYRQENGLPGVDISAIYIDSKNNKYVGSRSKGMVMFNNIPGMNSPRYPLLENTTPLCFAPGDSNKLWIGTEGQGLLCLEKGKITRRITQEIDGLLSDRINLLYSDMQHHLYIGTNRGLNILDTKTGIISSYTRRNGFTGIETKNNAVLAGSDGFLWFGTANGAIRLDPEKIFAQPQEPLTLIRRFIVNFREHPLDNHIKLRYTQNSLAFQYSSICLTNPESVLFQVMLRGADNDWQPPTRETTKSYSALAPGKYTFMLRAKNQSGLWNSKPVEFSFIIRPPFYETWWFRIAVIIAAVTALFTFVKLREKTLVKEKKILEEKVKERTSEIEKINRQLFLKNKDITDSIQYASRIQNALFPPGLPFDHTFVLFKPKDIVSGDFFWFLEQDNMQWFAAVDCTGHGVPGAFMSIIGHNSLNKILQEYNITNPADILNKLNEEVAATLHQYHHDNQIHDGMDIALVSYDTEKHILDYAGAFNPLWIVRNKQLVEFRANRFAIGMAPDMDKKFTNHTISIEPGDTLYLFSDGYADQFGGPNDKKLKIGSFKELILNIQDKKMSEQKEFLDHYFGEWKGNFTQIDDVLVIGRKFEF